MKRSAFAAMFAIASVGCAGGHGWISAPTAQYPVSLSHAIRGSDGHLLANNERQIVGRFNTSKTFVSMLYDGIPLNGHFDISDDINAQVKAAGGEGITDLSFQTDLCALDFFLVFHMLPFWPGCATVEVHGVIIHTLPH